MLHGKSHPPALKPMTRCALITGGAKRIGRAIAIHLASEGWDIIIHAHKSRDAAQKLQEQLQRQGRYAHVVFADLTKKNDIFAQLKKERHAIGALINNASVFSPDKTARNFETHMKLHVNAPFFLSQEFAASLPQDQKAAIINITDQRVLNMTPYFSSYSISKAALSAMTKQLALALAPTIRVNAIAPGPILPHSNQDENTFMEQCRRMPLQHGASPQDVAHAVSFLLESDAITGTTIPVDGGQSLGWAHPSLS